METIIIEQRYKTQVNLLLKVLPIVAKQNEFALHGGKAINLFIRDFPRLSVDIDLTYIPIEPREISIEKINSALVRIKSEINKVIPKSTVIHKIDVGKLIINNFNAQIKLEVNLVGRGILGSPNKRALCNQATEEFNAFVAIQLVPFGQLYGGKICAALDRQHPRDLFDVQYLLEHEGISREVMQGFILALISNDRPIHEVLNPNFLDQRKVLENQFEGMSIHDFKYNDFEKTRLKLVKQINSGLLQEDKEFLLNFKNLTPNWKNHNFEKFPAVRWKLRNLEILKKANPIKYHKQFELLEKHLKT